MGVTIDHAKRRAEFTAGPGFSGLVLSRAIAGMFDEDPRTASYDLIFDLRGSDEGATQAGLELVAAAYHRHERTPGLKHSCFVSTDPNYPLWVAAIGQFFSDRQIRIFVTAENARAYLDCALAERDEAPPP
ncbi:hypothetical protein [Phenylobacterium sp.]|jgi:hypothetical protein|uniref:hypothetical protein n=1 Tax=Phenylobacterium sp. TaxID=1871053 RepID=UPI002F936025